MTERGVTSELLIRVLKGDNELPDAAVARIEALHLRPRHYRAKDVIVREGTAYNAHYSFLLGGIVLAGRILRTGKRHIVAYNMAGDFLDLEGMLLHASPLNLVALTDATVIEIDRTGLENLIDNIPQVAKSVAMETLKQSAISREWLAVIGQSNAEGRLAYFLCEYACRAHRRINPYDNPIPLPFTQEQIGEFLGLTSVHVNRTLMRLRSKGVVRMIPQGKMVISDWGKLTSLAGFDPRYLALPG